MLATSRGHRCVAAHGDDMASIVIGPAARPKSSPKGFVLARGDGSPAFTQLSHDFSSGNGMYISTTGWALGKAPGDLSMYGDGSKPNVATTRPDSVHVFVRAKKYAPPTYVTHMDDLRDSLEADPAARNMDFLLLGSDNGGQYGMDSGEMQHYCYRIFRGYELAMLADCAHAPNWSSVHFEGEGMWPEVRDAISGQHFGLTAWQTSQPGESEEEKCQRISSEACDEYLALLDELASKSPRISQVEYRSPTEARTKDADLVKEYYSSSTSAERRQHDDFRTIRSEARDLQHHLSYKGPSAFVLRFCPYELCDTCARILKHRRATEPNWDPLEVMAPLKANHYRMWLPSLEPLGKGPPERPDEPVPLPPPLAVEPEIVSPPAPGESRPQRSPYPSFLQLVQNGNPQRRATVRISSQAAWESVYPCIHAPCPYFARSVAEKTRHLNCHHISEASVAEAPASPVPTPVRPPVDLSGCPAAQAAGPRKKRRVQGAGVALDEAHDADLDSATSDDFAVRWPGFRAYAVDAPSAADPAPAAGSHSADPAAPYPAAAVAHDPPAPREASGWRVVEVEGGWLRWHRELGKLDSHCRFHGKACKMDRSLSKAPIGLLCAWLSRGCACGTKVEDGQADSKGVHDALKAELSAAHSKIEREAFRFEFANLANEKGGIYLQILEDEERWSKCGGVEPEKIAM